MSRRNVKNRGKELIYEFWAHDIATEVAKETLDQLGVPYKVEIRRRLRDPTAPKGCKYDEWAEIYVDAGELVKCLERRIDEAINSY